MYLEPIEYRDERPDKDYILQYKIRNGPMLRAMRKAGVPNANQLAEELKIHPTRVGLYLGLRLAPVDKSGKWRTDIRKIADRLKCLPEDLFPPQHLRIALERNSAEVDVSLDEIRVLTGFHAGAIDDSTPESELEKKELYSALGQAVLKLNAREHRVLALRYGLDGGGERVLDEVGGVMNIGRERVRQIEMRAIRKLRNPSKIKHLEAAYHKFSKD